MKKFFMTLAVAAIALTAVSCDGAIGKMSSDRDSLSYALGANMGLSLNLGMGDLGLNNDVVVKELKSFFKDGDVESEEFQAANQRFMEFQYTRVYPFMQAKMQREAIETDQPDTLPALPELYDENFTAEEISTIVGQSMGASLKDVKEDVDFKRVMAAFNDGLNVSSEEAIDTELQMTQEQMRSAFMKFQEIQRQRAEEERQQKMTENAEASAKWLSEVEQMEGVQKTESGLLYRIDREGDGAQATADEDVVLVNYEGKTREGKVFDSSYERGEPISFPLNRVIKGWTEGMKLVKTGGQITLWIPAEMAYGERGAGQDIGPNEALEFKVELLEVNPEE
ncbi:MAG: FKBP-type peptidyl-prolyl cis-trans isomerase [Alistipes sp.]|nr:FKBP-type peptidyl-prolyl cis-trans isomerase [Alistipes sp.]